MNMQLQPQIAQLQQMAYACEPILMMPKCARAYVPFQNLCQIYPPMVGLDRGTIFPELDQPYEAHPEFHDPM